MSELTIQTQPQALEDCFPEEFIDLLSQDGFVIFVSGGKEHGKTNFSMLLNEYCFYAKLRKHFATNIGVESYFIEKLNTYPDLQEFLEKKKGKKTYTMDELGKILKRMGFATKKNQGLMDIIQLIRHYDCGFIGNAPSERFVDSNFMNTDILDEHIKKISKTTAYVIDRLHQCSYYINDLPRTSIKHNGKDIATFLMEKPIDIATLKDCCKAALYYKQTKTFAAAGKLFNPPLQPIQVQRLVIQHLSHI
jgi:hypothetical protein